MFLHSDHWHLGYDQILKDCRAQEDGSPGGTALLLCNADVDALAAARIVSFMLRLDGIQYQLRPCTNYTDLHETLSSVELDDVRAVILLNFGAARNLATLFDGEKAVLDENVKVFVVDSRRPVHLANIYAGDNVVVFWEEVPNEQIPSDGENLSGNDTTTDEESNDDDNNNDDSDSESESSQDSDGEEQEATFDDITKTERQEETGEEPSDALIEDEDIDYDAGDEREQTDESTRRQRERPSNSESSSDPKRRKVDSDQPSESVHNELDQGESQSEADDPPRQILSPRELHHQRRERLRTYYTSGTFYRSPAAYMAYKVATQLRFGNEGDLLWLACVGVTDAYLHSRLDKYGYVVLATELVTDCSRLFPPNDMFSRALNSVHAEALTGGPYASDMGGNPQDATLITFSENGRIIAQKEFRFFLLRHSSLFDSMIHSEHISTKLQLWTKRGMHKLQELLAKMGYPLEECTQPFSFMRPTLRRLLYRNIKDHAEDYGLDNFEYTSFFRVTGYRSLLSASDTVYAVTALLECDSLATATYGSELDWGNEYSITLKAFNIAYDALNPNGSPSLGLSGLGLEGHDASSLVNGGSLAGSTGIGAGIRLAMSLQRTIMSTAVGLVERGSITLLRHFRYAYLTCTTGAADGHTFRKVGGIVQSENDSNESRSHIFSKPLALCRLANYLMDMHRENGKWAGQKARPLVLLAEKPSTGTFLVVGYECPEHAGSLVRNRFGMNFELTAKSMNGTIRLDKFDSHVIEVDGADVQKFIEQLHYLLDAI